LLSHGSETAKRAIGINDETTKLDEVVIAPRHTIA
jgi:hypothetical protein